MSKCMSEYSYNTAKIYFIAKQFQTAAHLRFPYTGYTAATFVE